MICVKTCATSANLGPGFDTLGIAFELYNTFEVDLSDTLQFEGVEAEYANEDNLFYQAFRKVCEKAEVNVKCRVKMTTGIPISRGLGSSASLIVAGAVSANELLGKPLNIGQIFEICTAIEGHPDNVAPCLFGGLTCSYTSDKPHTIPLPLSDKWCFTAIVPEYPLSTEKARAVLPETVSRNDAVFNAAHVALLVKALEMGTPLLLKEAAQDKLHQPFRKQLIRDYEKMEQICYENGASAFMLSGAGPTTLVISDNPHFADIIRPELNPRVRVVDLKVNTNGPIIENC